MEMIDITWKGNGSFQSYFHLDSGVVSVLFPFGQVVLDWVILARFRGESFWPSFGGLFRPIFYKFQ